uniref:Uncharacterized protein n=1 Tax=Anguilla anguilla TaxID=7936 RepID=A0A0E9W4C5_ANGAN
MFATLEYALSDVFYRTHIYFQCYVLIYLRYKKYAFFLT